MQFTRSVLIVALPGLLVSFQVPFVPNYDEAKVGEYKLPDPLVFNNGKPVKSAQQWRTQRRVEIVKLFEDHVYGRSAAAPKNIEFEITNKDEKALNGLATRKEVAVWLTGKRPGPVMHILLYMPNEGKGSVPVFLGYNFEGNQAIHNDPGIPPHKVWARDGQGEPQRGRGTEASRWQVEKVLRRGYAVASIYYGEVFPDKKDGLAESIIPVFYRAGQTQPDANEWNAVAAWGWGLSRALDVIEKDKDLDAKHVAVWGHSRLGKAALWAGAQDQRFAMVISNDSGESGAALARRNYGETVWRINDSFPHWFNGNYKKYSDRAADLPVDQHMVIALCAPRPVYIASAQEDRWADPRGEFLAAVAADPVYRLLGTDGIATKIWPSIHEPIFSTIGYHIRAGKHDVTAYDWDQYLTFADRYMRKK